MGLRVCVCVCVCLYRRTGKGGGGRGGAQPAGFAAGGVEGGSGADIWVYTSLVIATTGLLQGAPGFGGNRSVSTVSNQQ